MFNVIGRRRKDTVCFSSYNSLFLWIYKTLHKSAKYRTLFYNVLVFFGYFNTKIVHIVALIRQFKYYFNIFL